MELHDTTRTRPGRTQRKRRGGRRAAKCPLPVVERLEDRLLMDAGRANQDPLEFMSGLNVRVDQRRVRRALTPDECRRLLAATALGPHRHGMDGPERALLYRLALETGLRASELKSLTRGDFDLDAEHPAVTIRAGYSKNRREDTLPLRRHTAALLGQHLINKPCGPRWASLGHAGRTAGTPWMHEPPVATGFCACKSIETGGLS